MKKSKLYFTIAVILSILESVLTISNKVYYFEKYGTQLSDDPHSPRGIIILFIQLFIFVPLYCLSLHYAKKENAKVIKCIMTVLLVITTIWALGVTLQALNILPSSPQ